MKISITRIIIGIMVIGGVLVLSFFGLLPHETETSVLVANYAPKERVFTDHTNMINGPFKDGPSVTRNCLSCHPEAGEELLHTQHWEWLGEEVTIPGQNKPMRIGKANLINNFCIGIKTNNVKCTSCHAGYGWEDDSFDFSNRENIDCLVCHERSGQYSKGDNGLPQKGVDLLVAAKSVTTPDRNNCGTCHFSGGGGNGVKHGDLDGSLAYPSERIDIHMSKYDMLCVDCHRTENHMVPGRSMGVSVDDKNRVLCTDCHRQDLHKDERISVHLDTVTCQTCHIPKFALDDPTKTWWDWSTAGQDLNINDKHKYMKIKGSFHYEKNIIPEYHWYNGKSDRYIVGDSIDPSKITFLNYPHGNIHDKTAKISPFKIHWGKQVYDTKYNYFLVPTTAGKGGYWHEFNWDKALKLGSQATGLAYSGKYGFASTGMFWKISHMVAPKEDALQCADCHGDNGRMNWHKLGFEGDPIIRGDRKRLGKIDDTKAKQKGRM